MNRRNFVKGSMVALGGSLLLAKRARAYPPRKLKFEYIREDIPPLEIPAYRGERYEDRVPDTLDIAERSELGVHGLTACADPEADHEVWWAANFSHNPPYIWHDFNDWVQIGEGQQEALPLLRIASGSGLNDQVDPSWMKAILKGIGPDGLVYIPEKGRPWSRLRYSEVDPVWRADGSHTRLSDESVTQFTNGFILARTLGTLTVYYLRDRNPMWKQAGEKMVSRLRELAVNKGDYAYLPAGSFEPNAKVGAGTKMPAEYLAGEWDGRLIQGLAQFYKVTGHEPAIELAGRLTRYWRHQPVYWDAEGRFLDGAVNKPGGHGHEHTLGILCMLEYAAAINDHELLDFVNASYQWAKSPGPEYGVSTLVGWFPEVYVPNRVDCESGPIGDMIGNALKLTAAGMGDYWDDVDRWVRNQFVEGQLTSAKAALAYRLGERPLSKSVNWSQLVPPWPDATEMSDHAADKQVGGFNGGASGNDWAFTAGVAGYGGIAGCCTGNCTRALYYVWEHMVEHKGEEFRVNLLLNRASQWGDVYSYIPCEGRVDIKMKKQCGRVLVRAPEWVKNGSPEIKCQVNGASRRLHWERRYVNIGVAKPGERIEIRFPITERTVKEKIGPETYTVVLKGSTVVSIDPVGKYMPLYQDRAKYRKNEVQWRKVSRFVPQEEIVW